MLHGIMFCVFGRTFGFFFFLFQIQKEGILICMPALTVISVQSSFVSSVRVRQPAPAACGVSCRFLGFEMKTVRAKRARAACLFPVKGHFLYYGMAFCLLGPRFLFNSLFFPVVFPLSAISII